MDQPPDIIDAHHHLWDLRACHYPWLMARGVKRFFGDPTPIQKNYLIDDFFRDIGSLPVTASIHIQAGVEENQAVAETRWLQSVADTAAGKGFPQGIIAFCNLADPGAMDIMEQHARFPNLRGIRQITGRSPEEDAVTGSNALLENSAWLRNLARLAEYGLSFDLQLVPHQLRQAKTALAKIPYLKVALCHCGSPFDRTDAGLALWEAGIAELAELPNVYCKLSGFGMFDHGWNAASIRRMALHAIDVFTPDRCMFGSNFPVDSLYAGYADIWAAYNDVTSDFSDSERRRLFAGTARRFYSTGVQDLTRSDT